MAEPEKTVWKRGSKKKKGPSNLELLAEMTDVRLTGLVCGTCVWLSLNVETHAKLEAMVTGLVDGGRAMGDRLHALLSLLEQAPRDPIVTLPLPLDIPRDTVEQQQPIVDNETEKPEHPYASSLNRYSVRLGGEEALFLMHGLHILTLFSSTSSNVDPWLILTDTSATSETSISLRRVSPDDFFKQCCATQPRFLWRYLVYYHYRAKGWMLRSGVQFGADFVLYQAHPSRVHSQFSVLVVPTALLPSAQAWERGEELAQDLLGKDEPCIPKGAQLQDALTTNLLPPSTSTSSSYPPPVDVLISAPSSTCTSPLDHLVTASALARDPRTLHGIGNLALPPACRLVDPIYQWSEIRAVARVQTQVSKRLLMCFIGTLDEGPLVGGYSRSDADVLLAKQHGVTLLEGLVDRSFIQEMTMLRWSPDRNRDA